MTTSQKPYHTIQNQDGTVSLRNAVGKEIGTIKDPRDADEIVETINAFVGDYSNYGGNTLLTYK